MVKEHSFIDSVSKVKEALSKDTSRTWKEWEIRQVLRNELHMRFKKVKPVSVHANSKKNLVLRQQFALELIKQLHAGKTILNVDETWLGMSDFRRMKWCPYKDTNSVPVVQLQPRVSMIVALDTNGRVYLSLLQSNNNASTMDLFLRALVKKLKAERGDWQNNTVMLWDNAPYHSSKATLKVLEQLKIPTLFTGPHSYDASPVELFFAHFKDRDINPRHVPSGKS